MALHQQSASQSSPPLANQSDFSSHFQIRRLHQDLAHAQKQIQEYEDLIASLYTALHNVSGRLQRQEPSSFPSKHKFSLPRSSPAPSNPVPFWRRVFKSHSRTTDSANSDIPGRSGLSQLSNPKASDFIQPNRSVSVSSESIQPSPLSVTQQPTSLPETSTRPTDVPNHLDWSVDFDGDVKRALNVKLEHVLTPGAVVGRVRFSPDGEYLAVGVDNGTYIYDVKTGAKSCFLADNSIKKSRIVRSLCFSPEGKYLAVVAADGQIRIWEVAKKCTRNIFREHTDTIADLDFSPNGLFLVSCSYCGTVRIWRMRDGFSKVLEDKSASSFYYSARFNPDGQYIAAGNIDGMVGIWNVRTSQLVAKWSAHGKLVWWVAFTLDGKGLVSSSGDETLTYWDISFLELSEPGYGMTQDSMAGQKSKVMAHTNNLSSIAISPDSRWVVSGSTNRTVRIWDLRNAALQCTLKGHEDSVWSVDFCSTRGYLASGSRDRIALWRCQAA